MVGHIFGFLKVIVTLNITVHITVQSPIHGPVQSPESRFYRFPKSCTANELNYVLQTTATHLEK